MSYPAPTTGIGVAAKINVAGNGSAPSGKQFVPGYNDVTLSLTGSGGFPETFQLNPEIVDVANTPVDPGTAYVLSAAASSSGNTAVYTGTIGASSNTLVGQTVVIAGFVTHTVNNGTFLVTANNGSTTITVENAAAVSESHAATATLQETTNVLTYFIDGTKNYNPQYATGPIPSGTATTAVATVSASGLITSTAEGGTVIEVSYPTFNNTSGTTGAQSGNPMHGLPLNKIYAEVNVTVVA